MNSSVEFLVTRLLSAPSSSGPTCLGSMPASVRNGSSGSSGTGALQGVEAGERLGSQDMGDGDERGLADRAERRWTDWQRRAEVPTQVFDHQADGDVVSSAGDEPGGLYVDKDEERPRHGRQPAVREPGFGQAASAGTEDEGTTVTPPLHERCQLGGFG